MQPSLALSAQQRLEPGRSATWPPTTTRHTRVETDKELPQAWSSAHPTMASLTRLQKPASDPLFEAELSRHPEEHFLSPAQIYEFEDWTDDSDDDDDFVDWNAGITDFALFNDDKRQAEQRNEEVPDRWRGFLASQASALQRADQRSQTHAKAQQPLRVPQNNDLPQLTPDHSPDLGALLDVDDLSLHQKRCSITAFVTGQDQEYKEDRVRFIFEDDDDDDDDDEEDDEDENELPVAYLVQRARERRRQILQWEKPGMRFNHTLSGKTHVWKRPARRIYDVDEDVEAEAMAELQLEQS